MASLVRRRNPLLSIVGVSLAFGVPAVALVESNVRGDLSLLHGALLIAVTPWLILVWVVFAERRPLSSIGLHQINWVTVGFGLIGIIVNVAISITIGALGTRLGLHEPESDFVARMVRQGYGWVVVVIVTSGAAMTEIAWRGYALERLRELAGGRWAVAAAVQIVVTTALFLLSRPAHTLVWVVDDAVFTAFYVWSRNTVACLAAHAIPNFIASTLVALGFAR